jgi:agmatine/peptidylarginine deiminase
MPINYQRMQQRSDSLLRQNGAEYPVTRKGTVSVVGGVEYQADDLAFTAWGVKTEYDPDEIDGTAILRGDVKIVFNSERVIDVGDLVTVDGRQHRVIKPNLVKPASIVICYKAQLRA